MTRHYDEETGACHLCGKCLVLSPTLKHYTGVDPCLGLLPDVVQACCGHGGLGDPYVVVAPGHAPGTWIPDIGGRYSDIHGSRALDYFEELGVGPPCSREQSLDNIYTKTYQSAFGHLQQ